MRTFFHVRSTARSAAPGLSKSVTPTTSSHHASGFTPDAARFVDSECVVLLFLAGKEKLENQDQRSTSHSQWVSEQGIQQPVSGNKTALFYKKYNCIIYM